MILITFYMLMPISFATETQYRLLKRKLKNYLNLNTYFLLELKFLERRRLSLTGKDWDLKVIGILMLEYCVYIIRVAKKRHVSDSLNEMIEKKHNLLYWDQDLMNIVFDDRYIELNKSLNFELFITKDNVNKSLVEHLGQDNLDTMSLIHYQGSMKPWTVRAAFNKRSIFYHDAYYELFNKKYKIVNSWKVSTLTQLFNGIFKLYIKNLRYLYRLYTS